MSNQINDILLEQARELQEELGADHMVSRFIDNDIKNNDLDGLLQHVTHGRQEAKYFDAQNDNYPEVF